MVFVFSRAFCPKDEFEEAILVLLLSEALVGIPVSKVFPDSRIYKTKCVYKFNIDNLVLSFGQ